MQTQTALEWTRRIERAQQLRQESAAAEQLLAFYEGVLRVQSEIAKDCVETAISYRPGSTFKDQIDLDIPLRKLPGLVSVTRREGTKVLVEATLGMSGEAEARRMLESYLSTEERDEIQYPEQFFVLALLQPVAEHLAGGAGIDANAASRCPACNSLPLLATLRQEGDGAKRFLQCSFCLHEWAFRRVLCPWCGETDKEKLPRYSADECNYVRVEGCDTCKRYLKSIDLTVNGHAVSMIDEVALAALDVWAVEQGFKKIANNLLGF